MVSGSFRPSRRILRRTLAFGIWLMFSTPVWGSPQTFPAHIETDKEGYLAGEPVRIVGRGFNPSYTFFEQNAHTPAAMVRMITLLNGV